MVVDAERFYMKIKKESPDAKYKDKLFRYIFGQNKEWLLSLYNAVNGTEYQNPEDIRITTLEDVIYIKMKNDISLLLDSELSLYEHQSKRNPQLLRVAVFVYPVRGFGNCGKSGGHRQGAVHSHQPDLFPAGYLPSATG